MQRFMADDRRDQFIDLVEPVAGESGLIRLVDEDPAAPRRGRRPDLRLVKND